MYGMLFEKRQADRFDILLNVKIQTTQGTAEYQWGITRDFSCQGFSFESRYFKLVSREKLVLKIQHPKKNTFVSVISDVVWKKNMGGICLTGIKFREIDKYAKNEILEFVNKINKKQTKQKGSGKEKI
jgi:c-di-GMP-binding flagellar brake protein YcgR